MKVLILDRSAECRGKLKAYCLEYKPDLERVDVVESIDHLMELTESHEYKLFFLNLETDHENLLDFLKTDLGSKTPTVFTSIDKNKILDVFYDKTAGFITKPLTKEKFNETLANAKKRNKIFKEETETEVSHFKEMIKNGVINRIALATLDGYIIVHYNEIIRCEANGNYTCVYFHDGSFLMLTKTLKHYASKLEAHGFLRIHKTHLVNLKYVRSYVKGKSPYVELKDGSNVEVSLRKKQVLVDKLLA